MTKNTKAFWKGFKKGLLLKSLEPKWVFVIMILSIVTGLILRYLKVFVE